ncbi:MAG: gas vesicle protein [Pseudomonadota bacterium]
MTSPSSNVYLSDLMDRLLSVGVVVRGSLILTIADIELIYIDLAVMLSSFEAAFAEPGA